MQVGVPAQESRREAPVQSEHVVHHKHLAVAASSGSYSDYGDCQFVSYACGKRCRDFLDHNAEASDVFEKMGVRDEFFCFGILFGPDVVGAELVDRLRCQAKVSHHGYSC